MAELSPSPSTSSISTLKRGNSTVSLDHATEEFSCVLNSCSCCPSFYSTFIDFLFSPYRIHTGIAVSFCLDQVRHFWRALSTNLAAAIHPSDSEKAVLRFRNVTGHFAINYIVWRRSCIYIILVPVLINLGLGLYQQLSAEKKQSDLEDFLLLPEGTLTKAFNLDFYLSLAVLFLQLIAFFLFAASATIWYAYRRSRILIRLAWLAYFFSPFLVTVVPYRYFVTLPQIPVDVPPDIPKREGVISLIGIFMGGKYFFELAPPALTLGMAFIRAALNLRSLVPSNPLMGYMCILVPLVTSPLVWLSFTILMQAIGDPFFVVGQVIFSFSPLIFVAGSGYLTSSMPEQDAFRFATRLRYGYMFCIACSIAMFAYYITHGPYGAQLIEHVITWPFMVKFVFAFLSEYFSGTVFASDLYMAVLAVQSGAAANGRIRQISQQLTLKAPTEFDRDMWVSE